MEKRQIRGKGVFDAKQVGERPASSLQQVMPDFIKLFLTAG